MSEMADEVDKGPILKKALLDADVALPPKVGKYSGTTAIIAVVQHSPSPQVIIVCVGDSRCVLGSCHIRSGFLGTGGDGPWESVQLSEDQKPDVRVVAL